jgi:hypothetical protein
MPKVYLETEDNINTLLVVEGWNSFLNLSTYVEEGGVYSIRDAGIDLKGSQAIQLVKAILTWIEDNLQE